MLPAIERVGLNLSGLYTAAGLYYDSHFWGFLSYFNLTSQNQSMLIISEYT